MPKTQVKGKLGYATEEASSGEELNAAAVEAPKIDYHALKVRFNFVKRQKTLPLPVCSPAWIMIADSSRYPSL